ncbi:Uncharacterised protein [Mycobacteroides abscessus subsp. abscessus]|nr:Uncharacterised protein [Mycobacteroides abscessus subsp. abscessus]
MGVGGDDGTRLVADGGVVRRGGRDQGVEEVGVPVAHEAEDLVDVAGEGVGDMRRGVCHERPFAERDMERSICVSLAHPRLRALFSNAGLSSSPQSAEQSS